MSMLRSLQEGRKYLCFGEKIGILVFDKFVVIILFGHAGKTLVMQARVFVR
jgi:hypothetical protein